MDIVTLARKLHVCNIQRWFASVKSYMPTSSLTRHQIYIIESSVALQSFCLAILRWKRTERRKKWGEGDLDFSGLK